MNAHQFDSDWDWHSVFVPINYTDEMIDKLAEQHCQGFDTFRIDFKDFQETSE